MLNSEVSGSRNLVITILKQALNDATLCKNPKKPKVKLLKRLKNYNLTLKNTLFFVSKNYHILLGNKVLINIAMMKMIDRILNISEKKSVKKETLAYDARNFLNDKNSAFCLYTFLINVDPTYAYEKIRHQLKLFDKGKKNLLKNKGDLFDIIGAKS